MFQDFQSTILLLCNRDIKLSRQNCFWFTESTGETSAISLHRKRLRLGELIFADGKLEYYFLVVLECPHWRCPRGKTIKSRSKWQWVNNRPDARTYGLKKWGQYTFLLCVWQFEERNSKESVVVLCSNCGVCGHTNIF